MNRILLVILAVLLILSIFASCVGGPCRAYEAPIEDVYLWANETWPLKYSLYVVSGGFACDGYSGGHDVTYNYPTLLVDIFNGTCNLSCPPDSPPDSYVAQNISLSKMIFQPGKSYMIQVNNNVTITFVAGGVTIYLAPIHDIEIWADNSSPPQYLVDVVSEESSFCDHFDSYNVTRADNTTIIVEIFNLSCGTNCTPRYRNVEHTIPLGSDFVTGGNYTVVVNNVTETFVA